MHYSPQALSQSATSTMHRKACSISLNFLFVARAACRNPPLNAFLAALRLPSTLWGPVDRVQGFHSRISLACRARRSGVHPFLISNSQ